MYHHEVNVRRLRNPVKPEDFTLTASLDDVRLLVFKTKELLGNTHHVTGQSAIRQEFFIRIQHCSQIPEPELSQVHIRIGSQVLHPQRIHELMLLEGDSPLPQVVEDLYIRSVLPSLLHS